VILPGKIKRQFIKLSGKLQNKSIEVGMADGVELRA
jgi:hypothetical protein